MFLLANEYNLTLNHLNQTADSVIVSRIYSRSEGYRFLEALDQEMTAMNAILQAKAKAENKLYLGTYALRRLDDDCYQMVIDAKYRAQYEAAKQHVGL